MNRRKKLILLSGLLAALSYGARALYRSGHFVFTDDASVESQLLDLAPRVSGVVERVLVGEHQRVKRGQLLMSLDGRDYLTALRQAQARLHTLRQNVRAQTLKVELCQQETRAQLEHSQARILASQALLLEAEEARQATGHRVNLSQLNARQSGQAVETARRRWRASQEQVRAVAAQARRAELDWRRYQKLYAQEAISKQQLDAAQADFLNLRDRQQAERQQALALFNEIGVQSISYQSGLEGTRAWQDSQAESEAAVARRQAELAQSRAQLHQAESGLTQVAIEKQTLKQLVSQVNEASQQLRQAQLNLSYTKLYAPWDGVVGQRPSEVGAFLKAGQRGLQLVSDRPWIVANFKETQLRRVHPGQSALVLVDFNSGHRLRAHVDSLQPATGSRFALIPPENASGNWVKIVQRVPVKLVLEEPAPDLLPGMSASVEVEVR
jgi:membrane fusion protein (multidrug efflux system)